MEAIKTDRRYRLKESPWYGSYCVGRKLVLNQLVDEELEAIKEVLGDSVDLVGFYSYGELAPFKNSNFCELHNQTMTITLIYEK